MTVTTIEQRFYDLTNTMSETSAALLVLAETIKEVSCQTHNHKVDIPGLGHLVVENR